MTYQQPDFTLPGELLAQIAEQGFGALPELIRIMINEALRLAFQPQLGVAPYQRSAERRGHSNRFKEHTARTRLGEITFAVPQVREGGFFPQALEKGLRSERVLTLSLAELYVQGVSTRKVTAIVEQLCSSSVSSSQVSRAAGLLDKQLAAWRTRPLSEMRYPYWMPVMKGYARTSSVRCRCLDCHRHRPHRPPPGAGRFSGLERARSALA